MPGAFSGGFLGLLCLLLAGCAGQPVAVTPQQALASVQTGQPLLSCRESCLAAWQAAQPQAAQLAAGRRWGDLAALVVRVGYEDDLSLYYLGNTAEGTGYPGAAASYYRQSVRLSQTSAACLRLSRLCGGLALPRAASLRLAAIERELRRTYGVAGAGPRRVAPAPGEPVSPAGEAAEPVASEAGPASAAPVSASAPSPIAPTPSPTPSHPPDYIEPPPLGR